MAKERGQHRAGKHTKGGQEAAASQPRQPKTKFAPRASKIGGVYDSKNAKGGLLGRLFGKK